MIDLHNGKVKQIVGSTLNDDSPEKLQTNFVAENPAAFFAEMYRRDNLTGGHSIDSARVMMKQRDRRLLHGLEACRLVAGSLLRMPCSGLTMVRHM